MLFKNKFEKFAIIVCLLLFFGSLLANISERFRFTEFRCFYLMGKISSLVLLLICLLWSGVNILFLFHEKYDNKKRQWLWIGITLFPILFFGFFFFIYFF
ncbi:conserved membrane hypothetical protein [Flavobacterium sp. 9AF]|nr:conserved membrane hypothetical protein [Flavobacterium sp. 9AF]